MMVITCRDCFSKMLQLLLLHKSDICIMAAKFLNSGQSAQTSGIYY